MKLVAFTLVVFCLLCAQHSYAQGGVWVWWKGTTHGADTGHYGTMGVPNIANYPPGRYQAAYWTDLNGNFWLFGGMGPTYGAINDLWEFKKKTKEWVWVNGPQLMTNTAGNYGTQGVPSTTNCPPARGWGADCWTDHNDDLWLFGGYGAGNYGDLWRYHIATNEWTWMSGPNSTTAPASYGSYRTLSASNQPGGKNECKSGWVDSLNRLWTYGGDSYTDFWMYDVSSNMWAWMKGSNSGGTGHWGKLGVEDSANTPSGRYSYTKWRDGKGNFYLFAGGGNYSDVWRFNPHTYNWTWMNGDSMPNDTGHYIKMCQPGHGNYPAGRYENQTAQTLGCSESFWTFGGYSSRGGYANDLWLYNTHNNDWTWLSGSKMGGDTGHFGAMGVPNTANLIPSRMGVCTWTDSLNNLWVFGGLSGPGVRNDLWEFIPDTACVPQKFFIPAGNIPLPSDTNHCAWQATYINIKGIKNIHVTPNDGSFTRLGNGDSAIFRPSKTTTYTVTYGDGGACAGSGTLTFTVHVKGASSDFMFSDSMTTLLSPLVHLFNNSGNKAARYEWIYNGQIYSKSIDTSILFTTAGTHCFTLVAIDTSHLHCNDTATHCVLVKDSAIILVPTAFSPNHDGVNDYFKIIYGDKILIKSFEIFNRWGQLVYESTTEPWNGDINGRPAETGTYVYFIQAVNNANGKRILKKGTIELVR